MNAARQGGAAMNPLLRELLSAHRIARDPETAAALQPLRIPASGLPVWGLQAVTFETDHYTPDPAGQPAIIVPVADDGRIFDLAATGLAARRTATRTGLASILGQDALEHALVHGTTLHLFQDPIEWLQHRCPGAVVVDWRAAPFALADLPAIACTTELLATQVDKALRQPLRVPPLFVREDRRAAA
jgi:hypothetical protein